MSWITSLFSSSVGTVIEKAGNAIDKLVTSDEERLALRNELEAIGKEADKEGNRHIESMEQELSARHKADMASDSWLSKNVRPLTLIFLTAATVLMAFCTVFYTETLPNLDPWVNLLTTLLGVVYVFYFGSRGIEKVQKLKK
ncbi:TMhelix containing protein [Vibrio phage 1.238.A._10N.261.52.F10]|uniref:TMhelix containing protein n=2 Tax=Pariacacavirus TaxID=2948856 RepID=A0A2I7RUD2_9CAUD|nr:holin [Vibrio phage 1.238.A._10N.261.52.F10]YP_010093469.1 holin [Vibrio phage 1.245.O._10N.261.54.C7]AUR97272.1 TMhelix containing protein [Vibrio phage 1.238.A._10N.261.52.F10]AUR97366.1 TMhelix containing protein [Vibrio phage 1.238.B._10N.261.52.F10]AUR97939.1 TMhelix containing protein [Vibrio phage 1.245.O._10N.261.54.C7]